MKKYIVFLRNNFSLFFFAFSIFFIFYTIYKSELLSNGLNVNYYKYFIVSIIFLFLSILSFYFNQKIKDYFIIILVSTVLSLYFFETYLFVIENFSKKERLSFIKKTKGNDTRSSMEVYEDLKKKYKNIPISFQPNHLTNLENYNDLKILYFTNKSYSKTVACNENGYYMIYDSDRFGFNNPDSEWEKKEIEYLLVGDSFTFGACVNRPDDIASVLRNLTTKSVLNLGWPGSGPLTEYAILREYLRPNVKKILWVYFENDLFDLRKELTDEMLKKYFKDLKFTQNLKLRLEEIDNIQNQATEMQIKSEKTKEMGGVYKFYGFASFVKLIKTRNFINRKIFNNYQIPLNEFKQILKMTKDLSSKNNSDFIFVYLPGYESIRSNYKHKNYKHIKKILEELNIPFIDIQKEVFQKQQNPLKFLPDIRLNNHYNVEGYKIVSETIYKLTK